MERALARHAPRPPGPRGAPTRPIEPAADRLVRSLADAGRALDASLAAALRPLHLSPPKYWLLLQLAESDHPLMLSELAAGQRCAPSNITQLVDRLQADGLVSRLDQPRDRRSKRVQWTAEGKKRWVDAARAVARVQAEFLGPLSPAARKALARGLAALDAVY